MFEVGDPLFRQGCEPPLHPCPLLPTISVLMGVTPEIKGELEGSVPRLVSTRGQGQVPSGPVASCPSFQWGRLQLGAR